MSRPATASAMRQFRQFRMRAYLLEAWSNSPLGLYRSHSAWGHQPILASGLPRLSTMDDPSASTPAAAPEAMAAVITAEGIQADGAQEPVDESPAPGPEDVRALTLGAPSAGSPFLLPLLVDARHHPSFLPRLWRWPVAITVWVQSRA
jgi:hypothetical protein